MKSARWIVPAMLVLLMLLAGFALAEATDAGAVAPHNYILLIDNSRSTTGRHSLGEATDPSGLRFDAAKLVYQNVVTSAAAGARGKLGAVVFCGAKNCVSYGPLDIDDPALDGAVGEKLNAEANASRRDDYTDIRAALSAAKEMLAEFEGDTSVLLLTDGVNDLTNRSDPFAQPENIEANAESIALAEEMREAGAELYVVALTAETDVDRDAAFMGFIDAVAQAGGGELTEDGGNSHVLMATQSDLNSKLLQTLIKAESASEAIQTIVEYTPVDAPFTVPYDGITDATVNITFMPEDKALLERVELVSPDGESRTLWDTEGAHESGGIGVTEDRSYIMLAIPEPKAGDWNVVVTSRKVEGADARVLINAVVRFNHNLRLNVDMDSTARVGEDIRVDAWFQRYNGEGFEDLVDSDIYAQSTASLTLITPAGNGKAIAMKREGERYTVVFRAKTPGAWRATLQVRNPYVQETSDDLAFEVYDPEASEATPEPAPEITPEPTPEITAEPTPEPTPMPTLEPTPMPTLEPTFDPNHGLSMEGTADSAAGDAPTPEPTATPVPTPTPRPTATPEPTVAVIESLVLSVEPSVTADTGEIFLSGESAKLSWQLEGEVESLHAALVEGDNSLGIIASGFTFPRRFFQQGLEYVFRVTAMPKNGRRLGAEPTVAELRFRAMPTVIRADEIALSVEPSSQDDGGTLYVDREAEAFSVSWDLARETERVEAELYRNGELWLTGLQSGDSIPRDQLEEDVDYALRLSALPLGGTLMGIEPTVKELSFRLFPKPQPILGLRLVPSDGSAVKDGVARVKGRQAQLYWLRDSGLVDHYQLTATDAAGRAVLAETLDGAGMEYSFALPQPGDYDVMLIATPLYPSEDVGDAVATLRLHALSTVEQYWYFLAAGAAVLVGGVTAAVLALKKGKKKRKRV